MSPLKTMEMAHGRPPLDFCGWPFQFFLGRLCKLVLNSQIFILVHFQPCNWLSVKREARFFSLSQTNRLSLFETFHLLKRWNAAEKFKYSLNAIKFTSLLNYGDQQSGILTSSFAFKNSNLRAMLISDLARPYFSSQNF